MAVRAAVTSRRLGVLGAAVVAAATAFSTVTAPPAQADATFGSVLAGPLFRGLQAAGFTSIDIPDVDVIGTITINFSYSVSDERALANAVNAFPFGGFYALSDTFRRQPGGTVGSVILGGSGFAALAAGTAYEALLSSAGGTTLPGYSPLIPSTTVNTNTGVPCSPGAGCVQGVNVTNLAVLQVNNPGTPNGGLFARFSPIFDLLGIPSVSRGGTSVSSTGLDVNAATIGLALGYNLMSDFPATLNPFSLVNSVFATLIPTHLLSNVTIVGDPEDVLYARLGTLAVLNQPSTSWSTVKSSDLPLLEPLRLPSRIINLIAGAVGLPINLGTPLADALQPALSILVNTGYTDVKTPAEGGTYNRTYNQAGTHVTFLSQAPLTAAEWREVPGDVVRALVVGFQDAFPILRFGKTAPTLTVSGNHLAITYPPASVTPPAAVTATRAAPVRVPVERAVPVERTALKTAAPRKSSGPKASAARHAGRGR